MGMMPQDWVALGRNIVSLLVSLYRPPVPSVKGTTEEMPKIENPKPIERTAIPSEIHSEVTAPILEQSVEQIIEREKGGDYCVSCVGSKHLMRAKDALSDALNIAKGSNKFTEVAESKIQRAVYELNAAEVDLEQAKAPDVIKPAVSAMHTQIRRTRDFLRQDASGLEIATALPEESFEQAKGDLEAAIQAIDEMIQHGYQLTKLQLRTRVEALRKSKENA